MLVLLAALAISSPPGPLKVEHGRKRTRMALAAVAVGHTVAGARLLASTQDELPIIFELLSKQACPSSVLLLLRSQALGILSTVPGAALGVTSPTLVLGGLGLLPCSLAAFAVATVRQPQLTSVTIPSAMLSYGTIAVSLSCARPATRVAARPLPPRTRRRAAAAAIGGVAWAVGAVAVAAPGASVARCFACLGHPSSRTLLEAALRCSAAALLPLGAGCLELGRGQSDPPQRRLLALALAAASGGQALLLLRSPHAHGLGRWARGALMLLYSAACGASSACAASG